MNDPFSTLNAALAVRVRSLSERGNTLFQTSANPDVLWQTFLANLPLHERQYHTCRCCQSFFRKYAGLAFINEKFELESIWPETYNGIYSYAMIAIRDKVKKSTVRAIFHSHEPFLGRHSEGGFEHFAFVNPQRTRPGALTAHELEALSLEHHKTLSRALLDFDRDLIEQAHGLLAMDTFYRSDKFLGPVEYLRSIHAALKGVRGAAKRDNVVWKALVGAPAGFATPRSSVVGTLLEDLKAGKSVEAAKRAFAAKTRGNVYQRPVAPARAGNIAQADKLVDRLGLAKAFDRRYAMLGDLLSLSKWAPRPVSKPRSAAPTSGLFSSALSRPAPKVPTRAAGATMSWAKFERTILPGADKIEAYIDTGHRNYGAYVTVTDGSAPLLFQWDNPVSWYVYSGGSSPSKWRLNAGSWTKVVGIFDRPCGNTNPNWGDGRLLALEGARDTGHSGLALFPEIIRSDLKSVRSTIEEFSKKGTIKKPVSQHAAGLLIGDREFRSVRLRVTVGSIIGEFLIDRFE